MIDGIKVLLIDLPCTVRGFTYKNIDDTYVIVLNSRLSYEQNKLTYEHEIKHITNDDFYENINVCEIEQEYHFSCEEGGMTK